MSDVRRPESREELDGLAYDELQALAADLGYGRIVGEAADDLRAYIDDDLDLDAVETASDEQTEQREHEQENEADEQPVETSTETDAVDVGHEGAEKLAPENAPDDQGTALEPPEDLNLDGVRPSDLEPETDETASDDSEPEEAPDDDTGDDESGGLLSRIKGDSQRTSDEIVDDADSEEERERRQALKEQLSERMDSDPDPSDDVQEDSDDVIDTSTSGSGRTHTPNGVVMDESLVGRLIDMPFNAASAATGWDGWELDEREREANAELFVAMCDEHDVDLSPTVMFALSLGGTASGKALRYKRYKNEQEESDQPEDATAERESESTTSTTAPAPRSTSEAPSENRETNAEQSIF
jgi:hypothetical protein